MIMGETQQRENDNTGTVSRVLHEGPSQFIDWLGNNEIRFGETTIATRDGTLHVDLDKQTDGEQESAGTIPNIPAPVLIGGGLLLAFLVLR